MQNTLYIFSGLPGVGKSTIAQQLCKSNRFAYVRIDTVEQGLKQLSGIDIYDEGYRLSHLIVADNLKLGLDVVADSCNPIDLSRDEWEKVARSAGAKFVNIEIICTDKTEHRCRVENRKVTIPGIELPDWQSVCDREFDEWIKDRVCLDTAGKSIEMCVSELETALLIK